MITITSIILLICCLTAMSISFYMHYKETQTITEDKTKENIFLFLGILNAIATVTTFLSFLFNFGN